jgi:hypothetical protein
VPSVQVPSLDWLLRLNTTQGSYNAPPPPTIASDGSGIFFVINATLNYIDGQTGAVARTVALLPHTNDGYCFQPAVDVKGAASRIFVACYPNVVMGLDMQGNVLFNHTVFPTDEPVWLPTTTFAHGPLLTTPPGSGQTLVVAYAQGAVYVLDAVTGLQVRKQIGAATWNRLNVTWQVICMAGAFRTPNSGVLTFGLTGSLGNVSDQVPSVFLRLQVPSTPTGDWLPVGISYAVDVADYIKLREPQVSLHACKLSLLHRCAVKLFIAFLTNI